jgi:O-succinylbenzoate synthase
MRFRFQFRRYGLPFRSAVRTAHGPWNTRDGIIVKLEDVSEGGTGAVGFGEAAPIPWFGTETVDQAEAGCRSLGEWIEETAIEAVPKELACLRNALASAQREIQTQTREATSAAAAVASVGVAALLPAGRAALALIEPKAGIGFRVFKWKVGVADLADELALLDDVCAALPNGAKLRLDANGAWDRRKAERWLERCADRPVEFVEQPCFAEASQGTALQRRMDDVLLGLAGDYPTPLALDESLIGESDLERWIGAGWPGVYVVKPSLFADITSAWHEPPAEMRTSRNDSPGEKTRAEEANALPRRALGFGVWPLFADARFDGPFTAPFLRYDDVARIDAASIWNALS